MIPQFSNWKKTWWILIYIKVYQQIKISPSLPCILPGLSKNLHDSVYGFMIPAVDETLGAKQQRVSLRALPPLHSPQTHTDRESQHPGEMGQTSEGKQYPRCAAQAVQSHPSLQ